MSAMADYFALDYRGGGFVHFGPAHLAALGVVLLANLALVALFDGGRRAWLRPYARYGLAAWLLVNQAIWYGWLVLVGAWSLRDSLPLHLCLVTAILCVVQLLTRSYRLYEIVYFWGLAGGAHALLTPDLTIYGFPHFRFWLFFTVHGALVTTVIYMTVAEGYRPTWASFGRFVLVTNLYLVVVALINWWTGGNYMYIAQTPEFPSLIDYLGPWPWYILSMEAIGIATALLCYLPLALSDWRRGEQESRGDKVTR
jgi:hypothetical integral membrane protein (TIGR02206 family)